ncbi:hypothetical protein T02_8248, partial [Trichinella nativa]
LVKLESCQIWIDLNRWRQTEAKMTRCTESIFDRPAVGLAQLALTV